MILTISPSSFEAFQECPTKYNYSSMRRLISSDMDRSRMDRGYLFHEMLQLHYKLLMEKVELNDIILHVTNLSRDRYVNGEYPLELTEGCAKNYQEYAIHYANDGWEIVAVEAPFSVVIADGGEDYKIILEGRIDLVIKNPQGTIMPVDHKTTEKKEQPNALSNQFMAYAFATNSDFLIKNEIGFQKTYGPAERFNRHLLNFPEPNREEWKQNLIGQSLKLIDMIESNKFEMRYSSCFRCQFRRICEAMPEAREHTIESKYTKKAEHDIFA